MLEAFYDRLRHLCADDGEGIGLAGERLIEWQAKHARALAHEWEILKVVDYTWDQWRAEDPDVKSGSEHIYEKDPFEGLVRKTTIPGKFGLMPYLVRHEGINLSAVSIPLNTTVLSKPGLPLLSNTSNDGLMPTTYSAMTWT